MMHLLSRVTISYIIWYKWSGLLVLVDFRVRSVGLCIGNEHVMWKTEMLFVVVGQVGPRNRVLDGRNGMVQCNISEECGIVVWM